MRLYKILFDKVVILEKSIKKRKKKVNFLYFLHDSEPKAMKNFNFTDYWTHFKLNFYKFLLALTRIYLIFKNDPASNFMIFTNAGKEGVYLCNYSYCNYKGFQKSTKKRSLSLVIAATVIVSLVVALIFPGEPISHAASRTWTQTDWSGLEDAGAYPADPANLTNWNKYAVGGKDANIDVATVGEAKLSVIADATPAAETADTDFNGKNNVSSTDSTDTDFNNGLIKTDVVVSNGVKLGLPYVRPSAPSTTNLVDLGASEAACASAVSGANCTAGGTLGTCALASGKCSIVYTTSGTIPLINAGGKTGFYNVGTFTVNSNIAMTIPAYDGTNGGRFYVLADTINLNGPAGTININGSAKGYRGGAAGGADASGNSSPDIKTSSYGREGGIGGGNGAPATPYAAYGNDGSGNADDLDMGGGGGGGAGGQSGNDSGGSSGGAGGAGGGAIYLYSSGAINISGKISVIGGTGGGGGTGGNFCEISGTSGGGGGAGAAGGGIVINGNTAIVSGSLLADAGSGGGGGSGGTDCYAPYGAGPTGASGQSGGSGRIKLYASLTPTTTGATITAGGYLTAFSGCNSGSIYCVQSAYAASGTFTSRVFDLGANQNFGKITWTDDSATVGGGSSVAMEVRSGNSNPPTDGTWTSVTNGGSLNGFNNKQYIQYKATLNSKTDLSATPTLSEVKIYYESTWSNAVISATDVKLATVARPSDDLTGAVDAMSPSTVCTGLSGGAINGTKCDWTPANGSTISGNYYNIGVFNIPNTAGYTVNITAGTPLKVHADSITIGAQATLNGNSRGYTGGSHGNPQPAAGGSGPGGGSSGADSGGGGGYASAGGPGGIGLYGVGGTGGSGNIGTPSGTEIAMGSGAGGGGLVSGTNGNPGGGAIYFFATGDITINGTILANGGNGGNGGNGAYSCDGGGGGGGAAGGGILINGSNVAIGGTLTVNGGNGGTGGTAYDGEGWPCNGGSGNLGGSGRIKLYGSITNTSANYSATGYNNAGNVCTATSSLCNTTGSANGSIYSSGYQSSGIFTSQIINTGQRNTSWGLAEWTAENDILTNTAMTVKVRSCDDAACSGETAFTSIVDNFSMTGDIGSSDLSALSSMSVGDQYVQYQVTLTSTDGVSTPTFADLEINSSYYPVSQTLTSSAYNSGNTSTMVNSIAWNPIPADQPANTTVKFQVRTAPDSVGTPNWAIGSKWCGPTICAATAGDTDYSSEYYTAGTALNAANALNVDDQWIQYRVWLESTDGINTPTLTDVSFAYVMNTPACIGTVPGSCSDANLHTFTPSQGSDGNVAISSYPVSDTEEGDGIGVDDGTVNVQFFYDVGVKANNSGAITGSATSITITDASLFPIKGYIMLANSSDSAVANQEVLYYGGKTDNTLNSIMRGVWPGSTVLPSIVYQTLAMAHTDGAQTTVWLWAEGTGSGAIGSGNKTGITVAPKTISDSTLLTPRTDLETSAYLTAARVRIAANDGNSGNSVGTADSGTFSIDTTVPVGNLSGTNPAIPVRVDLSNSRLDISVSSTAGSGATFMRFSNSDITTTACADESAVTWLVYPGGSITKTLSELSLTAGSTSAYTVYYQFRDDYCNMRADSASAPAAPVGIDKADLSYKPATISKYRDLVWWTAQGGSVTYELWRDPGTGTYAKLADIADPINYCFDEGDSNCTEASPTEGSLVNTTTYNYKVLAKTNEGISNYSAVVSVTPDGSTTGEAVNTDAPTIAVSPAPSPDGGASSGSPDSATITWTTEGVNASSYSVVNYGTNSTTLGSMAGNATNTSSASHSVVISGLTAGTTYYYQLISAAAISSQMKDPATPPTNIHSFTTSAPSVVEADPSYVASTDSAAIYWTTLGVAGTQIKYIASPGNPSSETPTTLHSPKTTVHYAAIESGLEPNTTYNYQIILKDGDNNLITYPTAPDTYYQFTTVAIGAGATTPVIVDTTLASQPETSASVTWTTTGDSSYSIVEYGPTADLGYVAGTVATADFTENHTVGLSNLTPGTIYHYKIRSANANGILATSPASGTSTFTTGALSITTGPAYSASRSNAMITWSTNGLADSRVEYGTNATLSGVTFSACPGSNTAADSCTSLQDTTNKITDHIVSLASLEPDTIYYYRVLSRNGAGTYIASDIGSFETISGDKPVVLFGSAGTPGENSVAITFQADKNAFLSVMYKVDADCVTACATTTATADASYTGGTGEFAMATADTPAVITINGLTSGTTYAYRIRARDIYGNLGRENAIHSFTTASDTTKPAAVEDLAAPSSDLSSTALTLTWVAPGDNEETGTASSYDIRYTTDDSVGDSAVNFEASWADASKVIPIDNEPLPEIAGTAQSMVISGLTAGTPYYFAIKTSDGNLVSDISNIVAATTLAYVDTTAAAITGVSHGTPSATSATITWTTDKASSSLVDFGVTASYGTTQGDPTALTTAHSVTLVGLIPGTSHYYYRVKSIDPYGNIAMRGVSDSPTSYFETPALAGTEFSIGSIAIPSEGTGTLTATTATITWSTDPVSADSVIGYTVASAYSASMLYPLEQGSASAVTSHSVVLTNLAPSTKYYFKVKSRNGDQTQTATDTAYTFTTLAGSDEQKPDITVIPEAASITSNKATITWGTSENASSRVEFTASETFTEVYTSVQGNPNDSVTSHTVLLTSLTPSKKYFYQIVSIDAAGNKTTDHNGTTGYFFSTTAGDAVDCPAPQIVYYSYPITSTTTCPVVDATSPVISDIKVSGIDSNMAIVTWTTDENSNSMVSYDIDPYITKGKFIYSSGSSEDSVKTHSVTLNNLDSALTYYFKVLSTDAKGNTAKSAEQTFKTLAFLESIDKEEVTADTLKKEFEDIAKTLVKENMATEENIKDIISRISNPPVIGSEGPLIKDIRSYGATITWQTDRKANSIVKFTASDDKEKPLAVGGSWREVSVIDTYDTRHEVSLLGLAPSTSYAFQAISQDILGNVASSEIQTFVTSSSSSIFNVVVTDLGLTAATINWETANLSSTSLEWGLKSAYGNYEDKAGEKVKKHLISLNNLSSGTVYHYRVRSVEEAGAILTSDDYTFTTPDIPQITKYTLGEVKDNSISLSWVSNIPIDSNIRYTNKNTNETKVQTVEEKTTDHTLTVSDLEAGVTYSVEIQGRDEVGTIASTAAFDVQTGMDIISPEISQVRSQSAIISGSEEKVQAIISWKTNELASTQIFWDTGSSKGSKFANETKLDPNFTTNHIAVITQFKQGMVYRYRVISVDKFGNTSTSQDYTILTPVKKQSVVQMIVNQFEDIFGWTNKIGK